MNKKNMNRIIFILIIYTHTGMERVKKKFSFYVVIGCMPAMSMLFAIFVGCVYSDFSRLFVVMGRFPFVMFKHIFSCVFCVFLHVLIFL
jgi:hypothetical protein